MAGFPRFEFSSHVFAPRRAQFGDDAGMLCREPVLKLVESFDGRENGGGNFIGIRLHSGSLSRLAGNGRVFRFMAYPAKIILTAALWQPESAAVRLKARSGRFKRFCRRRRDRSRIVFGLDVAGTAPKLVTIRFQHVRHLWHDLSRF